MVFHNFEVMNSGIYFIGGKHLSLRSLGFGSGTTRTITSVPEGYVGLSVSPDRESVLYTAPNPMSSNLPNCFRGGVQPVSSLGVARWPSVGKQRA